MHPCLLLADHAHNVLLFQTHQDKTIFSNRKFMVKGQPTREIQWATQTLQQSCNMLARLGSKWADLRGPALATETVSWLMQCAQSRHAEVQSAAVRAVEVLTRGPEPAATFATLGKGQHVKALVKLLEVCKYVHW